MSEEWTDLLVIVAAATLFFWLFGPVNLLALPID